MAEENTLQEEQQPTGIQFEDIVPWIDGSGDTGLSARLKLKRNFDKIKLLLEQQGAQQGGGVLTQPLTVNYKPNVGYLNGYAGITYNIGTPIETILRNILFQDMAADLSVSVSPSSPTAGTPVTLTATFDPGTSGLSVTGWQWYVDGSSTAVEGATDPVFTTAESSGTHTYKVVATLKGGTTMSVTKSVTWQTRQASVTVTASATEAEVGDTVTVTAAVALGSTATAVSAITCNGQAMSLSSGTTYTAQPQVQNGANEFEVEVTMNDGTVLTGNVSVTGYYKWFAGAIQPTDLPLNSAKVRALANSGKWNGAGTYKYNAQNWIYMVFVCPTGVHATFWDDERLLGNLTEMPIENFDDTQTVQVADAGGTTHQYYIALYKTNAKNDKHEYTIRLA